MVFVGQDTILKRLTARRLTLRVERAGQLWLASDRPGLTGLRDACFFHPELLDGAEVALPAVGLAAAYLLVLGKVGRIAAQVASREAKAALAEEGIELEAERVVKHLPPPHDEAHERLDQRAREAVSPHAFVEDLKRATY